MAQDGDVFSEPKFHITEYGGP